MRRLKLGNKVLGGIEPPKKLNSEYKDDISRGNFEVVKKEKENLKTATVDWVSQNLINPLRTYESPDGICFVHLEQGQTIRGEKTFRVNPFSNITSTTSETDIRATNTIGPNFSRRQQKDIDE